eukprot:gene19781-22487_t
MNLLYDLPKELVFGILLEWLEFKSTGRLDEASLSSATRPVLLTAILKDPRLIYGLDKTGIVCNKYVLHWVWKRRLGIQYLVLPSFKDGEVSNFELLVSYLKDRGTTLLHIAEVPYSHDAYGFFEKIPQYLNSSQLTTVLSFCPNLMELENISSASVSLLSMAALRRHCPSLRSLSIDHHEMTSWDPTPMISLVAAGNCAIERLRIPSVEKFWPKFATIVKNLPKLTHLQIDRHRDILIVNESDDNHKAFVAIAESCANLQVLRLADKKTVYDYSLYQLSQGCPLMQVATFARCRDISSVGVMAIAKSWGQLRELDLSGCSAVTDEGIVNLAMHCTQMQILRLNALMQLTDASLLAMAAHCTDLHTLDVAYCHLLTAASVTALATNCVKLTWLDLSNCTSLTDPCLLALADHRKDLSFLGLRNCSWVQADCLKILLRECLELKEAGLALSGCLNIRPEYFTYLGKMGVLNYT